jgi:hypothetical protein
MFLARNKARSRYWVLDSGDAVADDLAEGSTNEYWFIREAGNNVSLQRVTQRDPVLTQVNVTQIDIEAGGEVVGSDVEVG